MTPSKLAALQAKKKAAWFANMAVIAASEFTFEIKLGPRTVLFSGNGRPPVSFFPSTSRWVCGCKVIEGGAAEFLEWYRGLEVTHGHG